MARAAGDKINSMPKNAPYEIQWEKLLSNSHPPRYSVRVHPIPIGTWKLRPRNYEYEPVLVYWAMMQVPQTGKPQDGGWWTMWFAFRESPFLFLERPFHDGESIFVVHDHAPNHLMISGFNFNLVVSPSGTIAKAEVL
jgi:hypothetical protein